MTTPVRNIVILGGGTAGWLTAGTIAAKLKKEFEQGYSITLVESPNVPPIGVGEGTWPTMRRTLKNMGVRETDFIRECQVSFKQGAKFAQWVTGKPDDFYYHPLVLPQDFEQTNLVPHWQSIAQAPSFAQAVSPQETVCEMGLAPKKITTPEYQADINYAYHLDAGRFSTFLKNHCTSQLGVRHVLADVTQVVSATNGDIQSLKTQQGKEVSGDLFVDCSGFQSLLLGQHYQVPFVSCADVLFVDNAIAVQVPYQAPDTPIASHTISTGQSAGWIWDIGLTQRRGVGHVYSSRHISQDQAHHELLSYIKPFCQDPTQLNFKQIPITSGHRKVFWQNNCVAVGLSAGFLEPLEASALLLVEISANFIAERLPTGRQAMDWVAKRFNQTADYRWQCIVDFLKLHYMLSQRQDTAFWRDNRDEATIPERLLERLALWKYQTPWQDDFDQTTEVFPAASYQYVLYGMGFETLASPFGLSAASKKIAMTSFNKNIALTQSLLSSLPSNRELINQIKQYGLQPL
ncbi:tryptophan halogenase [Saccharobesus litoralis]|uniref:Tryptophan halogenase n=1 Tax=Saccharobesus litoralis TaxID=2172099 RepID=A0A2S0VNR4_9ALTE|nr:tryptophan halogenase family protein [Saccharobesus litoralis]AWB65846.1 tryptophan halogenase [Saccharobesus litoralis]